jgi:hypothetical protein
LGNRLVRGRLLQQAVLVLLKMLTHMLLLLLLT